MNFLRLNDGRSYYIDIDAITKVIKTGEGDRLTETLISEAYVPAGCDDSLELKRRETEERRVPNTQVKGSDAVRVTLIQLMIESVLAAGVNQELNGVQKNLDIINGISIGETISFNTLLNMGILVEIE